MQPTALAFAISSDLNYAGDSLELSGRGADLLYPDYSYRYFAILLHVLWGVARKTYSLLALLDVLLLA